MTPTTNYTLSVFDYEVMQLRDCFFLSRNRIKKRLKCWKPFRPGREIFIVVVEYENNEPTWKRTEGFAFPDKKDDFMVKLANLSDLHSIIKINEGAIWLRKVRDTKEFNIDANIMNRISAKLGLERV